MGLTYFSKSRKTKGARRQSWQQSKGMTLNIDGKVTNVGKSAKFIIHTDVFIACGSKLQHGLTRFSLSLQRPFNAERWAVFLPSGPGQNTPNLACCGRPTKETLESGCYLVRPHGKCRDWTQYHCSISSVWLTLAFHLLKCNRMSSIYFHFRSEAIWFSNRFFWAKRKIGLSYDPVSQRIWIPLPNFPLEHRSYHIWWLILFASFLSMLFSITIFFNKGKENSHFIPILPHVLERVVQ